MTTNGTAPKLNVHQRIAAVSAAVGDIAKTSRTQQGKAAMGIQDVEDALGEKLAEHGLVTCWHYLDLCIRDEWRRGNESVFQARLQVEVINVDDPDDRIVAEWTDTGSNPMAATSFTRKGFYKAIFHLAEKDDESGVGQGNAGNQSGGQQQPPKRKATRSVSLEGRACPECGDQLAIVYRDNGGAFIGHIPYKRDGCKWRPDPEFERELRDAAPPDPDPPTATAQTQPADDPVADRILASLRDLTEEQQRAIFTDERWARHQGESAKAWIGRLNAATRLTLTGEIGRLRTTPPAPEPEASSATPSQHDAPAPSPQQEALIP